MEANYLVLEDLDDVFEEKEEVSFKEATESFVEGGLLFQLVQPEGELLLEREEVGVDEDHVESSHRSG